MNRPKLTAREMEVLNLVSKGEINKIIGDQLGITERTVKSHVKNLLSKLKAPGRMSAVREAVHLGFIRLE